MSQYTSKPSELDEAIKRFNNRTFEKGDILYHYTDFKALEGIIKNKKIWLTDYRYLNDTSEIHYARDNVIKNIFAFSDEDYKKFIKDIHSEMLKRYPIYLISFSEDKNYLPNWRCYADDGKGVCIGFDAKALQDSISCEKNIGTAAMETVLEKVKYLNFQNDIDNKSRESFELFSEFCNKNRNLQSANLAMANMTIRTLFPQIKHSCYQEEKEVRFAVSNLDYEKLGPKELEFKIKYRHNHPNDPFVKSKPYIEYPIEIDWIKKIWSGPRVHQAHFLQEVKFLLSDESSENGCKIDIYHSTLPYKNMAKYN